MQNYFTMNFLLLHFKINSHSIHIILIPSNATATYQTAAHVHNSLFGCVCGCCGLCARRADAAFDVIHNDKSVRDGALR